MTNNNNGVSIPKQINLSGAIAADTPTKIAASPLNLTYTLGGLGERRAVNLQWVERMTAEGYLTEAAVSRTKQSLRVVMFGLLEAEISQEQTNRREIESANRASRMKREKAEEDSLSVERKLLLPAEKAVMTALGLNLKRQRVYIKTLFSGLGIMNADGSWNEAGVEKREGELEEILGGHEAVNLVEVK